MKSGSNHDVSMIIESTMQENVERKIETLTNIGYTRGKETFGTKGNRMSERKNRPQMNVK